MLVFWHGEVQVGPMQGHRDMLRWRHAGVVWPPMGRMENVTGKSQEEHDMDCDLFDDRRDGDVRAQ